MKLLVVVQSIGLWRPGFRMIQFQVDIPHLVVRGWRRELAGAREQVMGIVSVDHPDRLSLEFDDGMLVNKGVAAKSDLEGQVRGRHLKSKVTFPSVAPGITAGPGRVPPGSEYRRPQFAAKGLQGLSKVNPNRVAGPRLVVVRVRLVPELVPHPARRPPQLEQFAFADLEG